jgi:hypothetical protein
MKADCCRNKEGIMAKATLAKKLRIQAGNRVLILNQPEGYTELLGDLPEGVTISNEPQGTYDFVHLFVRSSSELKDLLPAAMEAAAYDGLFWISYPKQSAKVVTDLNRDVLWELMMETDLRPVTQVAVDPIWSALRFRPADRVGK